MDAWAKPQAAAVALVLWLLQPLPPLPPRGPEPIAANGAAPPSGGAAAAATNQDSDATVVTVAAILLSNVSNATLDQAVAAPPQYQSASTAVQLSATCWE